MSKKIIDVVSLVKGKASASDCLTMDKGKKRRKKKSKKFFKWFFIELILLFSLLTGVIGGLTLKARLILVVTLSQQQLSIPENVEVDINHTAADFQRKIMPGKFFEQDSTAAIEGFSVSGKAIEEGRASGVIRVYNNHNPPRSVFLVAQTRFLSQDGKTFKSQEKIRLSPATIEGKNVVPAFQDVRVMAQEAGEGYNISSSKFSLPGLVGGLLYYSVWAESKQAMEGGFKREVDQVSDEDLGNAKKELEKKLKQVSREELKVKVGKNFILPEQAISEENPQINCSSVAGAITQTFGCRGSLKVQGLCVKLSDVEDFFRYLVARDFSTTTECRNDTINYQLVPTVFNSKEGKMNLSMKFQCSAYQGIDKIFLVNSLVGKSANEIKQSIFSDFPQIKNAELKFWPFWIKRAPRDASKIEVKIEFSD